MSVEQKQIKNLRNRTVDFIKKTTPEKLIRVAVFLKIKVPDEIIRKYGNIDSKNKSQTS